MIDPTYIYGAQTYELTENVKHQLAYKTMLDADRRQPPQTAPPETTNAFPDKQITEGRVADH